MKIFIFLIFLSTNLLAMVPLEVPQAEKLFVRQQTPVWCWAAMAEAMTNYYHPEPKSQRMIALYNPNSLTFDKISTYGINPKRLNNTTPHDYLLDDVLANNEYQPRFEVFNHQKALKLLKDGNPIMVSQNFHVIIIYGVTELGGETYYNYFDPAAYAFFNPETGIRHQFTFDPTWNTTQMIYLTPKSVELAGRN